MEPTSPNRPKIELPSDLTYTFDWPKTGDPDKDAVLSDSEQSIKAVDLAIVNQDARECKSNGGSDDHGRDVK
ncbi:hypothetical protein ACWEQC_42950 [Streptomyces shenzhenensis]